MEMGGVSIFGKYCKEILGGGSDKKFPQRKNQLLLYTKKPYIKNHIKISTTEFSTLTINPINQSKSKKISTTKKRKIKTLIQNLINNLHQKPTLLYYRRRQVINTSEIIITSLNC